jgi:hypothetical protein
MFIYRFLNKTFFITLFISWLITAAVYTLYYPRMEMIATAAKMEKRNTDYINRLIHKRELISWEDRMVVRPNNDTVYSSAWIDLTASGEPMVLTIPKVSGRYYSFQFLDMDTNVFAVLGSRTQQHGHVVITSNDWKGNLPSNTQLLRLKQNSSWIIDRYLATGTEDLDNIHAIQAKIKLETLSQFTLQREKSRALN